MTSNRDAPTFYVKIAPPGAIAKAVDLTERVVNFTFDEDEAKADKVELDLNNFDLALFDDANWKHGNSLIVSWGYAGNMTPARTMVCGKLTGAKMLKAEALAQSILMNKDPKSRCFENMTVPQIIAAIAKEHGVKVAQSLQQEAATSTLPVYRDRVTHQQARMTDAQFLAHLARRHGFVFHVNDNGLHFERRNMGAAPTRVFTYYIDSAAGDVLDFNVENDVTMAPGQIVAQGRDPKAKKDIHESASNTETKREGVAPITHTVDPRTLTTQTKPIAQSAVILTTAHDAATAKSHADGKFIRAQQATVKLTLNVVGDPTVHRGQIIEVRGISKRLSGKYYVAAAKHKLSPSGYTLDLTCHSDGSHGSPAAVGDRSKAAPNTKPPEAKEKLKPIVVFVDGRTETTYRR